MPSPADHINDLAKAWALKGAVGQAGVTTGTALGTVALAADQVLTGIWAYGNAGSGTVRIMFGSFDVTHQVRQGVVFSYSPAGWAAGATVIPSANLDWLVDYVDTVF